MDYFELDLHPDIHCLWTIEESAARYNKLPIVPDSTIELVINCGAPLILHEAGAPPIELPHVFIKGLQQKPMHLQVTGSMAQLVGVRLNAWGIPGLPDVRHDRASDLIFPLDGRWLDLAPKISETVALHGYTEAVSKVIDFLDGRFQYPSHMQTLSRVGQILYETRGMVQMSTLPDACNYSLSQLERRFKNATGITLKRMARLIRFEVARDLLQADPSYKLADLAQELGYTDQSHFTRDFKAFAGFTPGS
jgi:AraC-like DNA-binding protein